MIFSVISKYFFNFFNLFYLLFPFTTTNILYFSGYSKFFCNFFSFATAIAKNMVQHQNNTAPGITKKKYDELKRKNDMNVKILS